MYSNEEKTDMIQIYGECNKNASSVYQYIFFKFFLFSQFRLTKRMTFMSKFVKLHS
jgi:hypothetical protein